MQYQFPKSVKESDTSKLKNDAESIKYLITNLEDGMKYSGSHKLYERGVFPDGYWHSSRNPEFIKLFHGMEPKFKYEIIDSGDHVEMKNLERDFHKKNDVKNNKTYYNLANAGGSYKVPVRSEFCKHIVQKIKDGKFRTQDTWSVEDLNKLNKLQVRFEVNPVGEIVNKMRQRGDASNAEPVLVWEVNGGTIGDCNRTLEAAGKAKITRVKTDYIPESFIKEHDINQDEIIRIGQLLNPVPEIEKQPTDDETVIKTLLKYNRDHNIPFDSPSNKEYISDLGFSYQKGNSLIDEAKERKDNEDLENIGKTVIRYDGGVNDPRIKKEVAKLEDDHTIVITGSSGSGKNLYIESTDAMEKKPNWSTLICKPYHGTEKNRKRWEGHYKINEKTGDREKIMGYRDHFERRIAYVISLQPKNKDGILRT